MLRLLRTIAQHVIEDLIRNISGPAGTAIRRGYYRRRLGACGDDLRVDTGVYFTAPEFIRLGRNVCIDKNVIVVAGESGISANRKRIRNENCGALPGEIHIGSDCHLGIGTLVQGHGGVSIGDNFTTSAFCAIYSLSNDPYRCRAGTVSASAQYVETPVAIGNNVWLGLQVLVIGNTVGDNCFVKARSVVSEDIGGNQIAEGAPAIGISPRFSDV